MTDVTVLIAEDEPLFREALADLITREPSLALAGVACDAAEAITLAVNKLPSVALVDVKMPKGGGVRAVRAILEGSPQTKVVTLSAFDDHSTVIEMLRAGATGYLVKSASPQEIVDAINGAVRGEARLSPEVTAAVIRDLVQQLEQSDARAEAAARFEKMKDEFIQILAHELRTPVTGIQGIVAMMGKRVADIPEARLQDLVTAVTRSTDRIARLAERVSLVASLESHSRLTPGPVSVQGLFASTVARFPTDAAQRILIDVDSQAETAIWVDPDLAIWVDPDLAIQALLAIVENALEFSPPDQAVELTARAEGDDVEVMVSDRGPGVPPDLVEHIFTSFGQGDSSLTRSHEGLGIGLFLAARIMKAHGSGMRVMERAGGGSVFTLVFPRPPALS